MKAIIFNSGLGKRMGEFTKTNHKSMVKLYNGETILERQIRILGSNGIKDFIITTGPFKKKKKKTCSKFTDCNFEFVNNSIYDKTNYIYSMFLAQHLFNDDSLLLHGDLVFDEGLIKEIINDDNKSLCLINEEKQLPQKDFKGRVQNGRLKEVSINIFDEDCYCFQPLYKLSRQDLDKWVDKVNEFVKEGNTGVYAENALNTILDDMNIRAKSYVNHYIDEIDNLEDYERVSQDIEKFDQGVRSKEDAKVYRKNI